MPSYIHNLDRESLLMLYMAGELPAEDHAEVEAMIAADSALRAQYEQMQVEQQAMGEVFAAADASSPLPAPQISSVRRVGAAMKQWHVDRLAKPTLAPIRARRKFGWVYATAASLLIVVGTIFFLWSRVDDGRSDAISQLVHDLDKQDQPEVSKPSPEPVAVAVVADPDDYTPTSVSDIQLSRVETDLSTVSALSDSLRQTEDAVSP
jgi:hypothetical protein